MTRIHYDTLTSIEGTNSKVMWANVNTDDGIIELFVDEQMPDELPPDYESDVYLRLLAEIREQAEDEGIDPDELIESDDYDDMFAEDC